MQINQTFQDSFQQRQQKQNKNTMQVSNISPGSFHIQAVTRHEHQ